MGKLYHDYAAYRDRMNKKILETENNAINCIPQPGAGGIQGVVEVEEGEAEHER